MWNIAIVPSVNALLRLKHLEYEVWKGEVIFNCTFCKLLEKYSMLYFCLIYISSASIFISFHCYYCCYNYCMRRALHCNFQIIITVANFLAKVFETIWRWHFFVRDVFISFLNYMMCHLWLELDKRLRCSSSKKSNITPQHLSMRLLRVLRGKG